MTKKKKIILIITGSILLLLLIYSFIKRKGSPKIYLVSGPGGRGFNAITLPPFGIFLDKNRTQPPNVILHESTHWKQYQEQGLLGFYLGYLANSIIHGYSHNPYEVAARQAAHECADYEIVDGKCRGHNFV